MAIKKRIEGGADFEAVAKEVSGDKSAQRNGGRIGFITAMLPAGMYGIETVAYNGALKKIHGPVKSNSGYHLVRVNGRRLAYGEVEIAHLLIRSNPDNESAPKAKIDSLYKALQGGTSFEDLVF